MNLQRFIMKMRNQRLSDVVAAVCVPASLTLYVLSLISSSNPQSMTYTNEEIEDTNPVDLLDSAVSFVPRVSPTLNVTEGCREDLLLATPILRCGATSLRNLLKLLRDENQFKLSIPTQKKQEVIHINNNEALRDLATNVSAVSTPTALMQAFAYVNFTSFGQRRPIHIALVRDPVDRAISWFYHARAPFQLIERHNKFPDIKFPTRQFLKKDLETCLKDRKDAECRYVPGRERLGHTIEFFCGHDSFCPIFGSREGLEKAKAVVEKDFAVVGVLEDWDKTLAVLEHYIPRYFKGAMRKFEKIRGNKLLLNENFYKPSVDPKAREFLARNFTVEMEFYQFIRDRLDRQYKAINP